MYGREDCSLVLRREPGTEARGTGRRAPCAVTSGRQRVDTRGGAKQRLLLVIFLSKHQRPEC